MAHELQVVNLLLGREKYSLYRQLDPKGHVQSLPGVGEVVAAALLSFKPLVDRLTKTRQVHPYTG